MAIYAYHRFKIYDEEAILLKIKEHVESWQGDIEIKLKNHLYVGFPMKYVTDTKTIKELSELFPSAEMEIMVTRDEGFDELYMARNGVVLYVNIDQIIQDHIEGLLTELYYRESCDEPTIKLILDMLNDPNISWHDATLRHLCGRPIKKIYKPESLKIESNDQDSKHIYSTEEVDQELESTLLS